MVRQRIESMESNNELYLNKIPIARGNSDNAIAIIWILQVRMVVLLETK
jgi:hypothetical protein